MSRDIDPQKFEAPGWGVIEVFWQIFFWGRVVIKSRERAIFAFNRIFGAKFFNF
jgi:hypothetical protein